MAQVRIFMTDRNGDTTLVSTVEASEKTVIHHVSQDIWKRNCIVVTDKARTAIEDIAKQNPTAVIHLCEEQNRMIG